MEAENRNVSSGGFRDIIGSDRLRYSRFSAFVQVPETRSIGNKTGFDRPVDCHRPKKKESTPIHIEEGEILAAESSLFGRKLII